MGRKKIEKIGTYKVINRIGQDGKFRTELRLEDEKECSGEKVPVPILNIRWQSDEEWNRTARENAVHNYKREMGHEPPSEEAAVKWQREWLKEILGEGDEAHAENKESEIEDRRCYDPFRLLT